MATANVSAPPRAAATPKVRPIPEGMNTLTPHLTCDGAIDALEFYKKAFGATEMMRIQSPDGKLMHACLKIGSSAVMLADEMPGCSEGPKTLKGTTVTLHLYVEDADAFVDRAVTAGAKLIMPVTEMFWGDRYGQVEDPSGHRWAVATHVRDLTEDEIREAAKTAMCGPA